MSDHPYKTPNSLRFIFSANAAMLAILVSHPFDLVKSRMQIAINNNICYRSMWHCFNTVLQREGFLGLYKGLSAAILRQYTYTATRLSTYTYLNDVFKERTHREARLLDNIGMGVIAGASGAIVGTPADVSLVRMTTDGVLPPEDQRHYKNVFDALVRIAREEGILNLWRGCFPTVVRAVISTTSQLASYSFYRRFFKRHYHLPEDMMLFVLASFSAGLTNAMCTLPVDLVKTRIQNQLVVNGKPQYKGVYDVLHQLVKKEGVFALWNGFLPFLMRVAPATVILFLLIEEQHKLYMKYLGHDRDASSGF